VNCLWGQKVESNSVELKNALFLINAHVYTLLHLHQNWYDIGTRQYLFNITKNNVITSFWLTVGLHFDIVYYRFCLILTLTKSTESSVQD